MTDREILAFLLLFPWTLVFGLVAAMHRLLKRDRKRDLLQMRILIKALRKKQDDDRK